MQVTLKMRVIAEQRVREVTGSLLACYGSTNIGRFVVMTSAGKNYAGLATIEALQSAGIDVDTAVAAE